MQNIASSKIKGQSDKVLCVPQGWDLYISREFHELHLHLASMGWTTLVIDEVSDADILSFIKNAQVALLWDAYEFIERNENSLLCDTALISCQVKKVFFAMIRIFSRNNAEHNDYARLIGPI